MMVPMALGLLRACCLQMSPTINLSCFAGVRAHPLIQCTSRDPLESKLDATSYSASRAPPRERLLTIFCLVVSTIYDLTSYVAAPLKKEHALPRPGYDSSHLASIYMYHECRGRRDRGGCKGAHNGHAGALSW